MKRVAIWGAVIAGALVVGYVAFVIAANVGIDVTLPH